MAAEVAALGVRCNLACRYCYQEPLRQAAPRRAAYDLEAIKRAILETGGPFCLFGGEPLLMKRADIEDLFAWGLSLYGRNSIQTNGVLIDDAIIDMIRRYDVSVGISIDGPGELNDARVFGDLASTRRATARTEQAVERLCREDLHPGLIVTLSRVNAAPDKLPRLGDWIRRLDAMGIRRVRLHLLEADSEAVRTGYGLTTAENIAALLDFLRLEGELGRLRFDIFDEMRDLLRGRGAKASCTWKGCDPYATAAVAHISGDGGRHNCGRTSKDGVDYEQADEAGPERTLALYFTPQSCGGCRDCRFFLMCRGQCPGTALGGDWRNRSEHCEAWRAVFEALERELVADDVEPVSLSPRRRELERRLVGLSGGA